MRLLGLSVVILLLGTPAVARASVMITEVAWMGSPASANHEWIELFNSDSATVSVDGWTLSDGASLLINLSGSIGAGEYVVLERTSDDTVSGTAFVIYTGALVNTGATLTLRRGDGQIEDRVEGGSDWQTIGGDNVSKYTAQYNGVIWQTAAPTPGAAAGNGSFETAPPPVTATSTTGTPTTVALGSGKAGTGVVSKSRSATIPFKKSEAPLQLAIGGQDVMYVHQPVTFSAEGSGVGKTIIASLQHRWNMGDMTMATGSKVTHSFTKPGTYIVALQSRFGKHDVVARKEVTVLPIMLSLAKVESDQILVQNDSVYDVDVSGYRVETDGQTLVFPPLSYLAAKQTVSLPIDRVDGVVVLKDPKRRRVASLGEESPTPKLTAVPDLSGTALVTSRAVSAPVVVESKQISAPETVGEESAIDLVGQSMSLLAEVPAATMSAAVKNESRTNVRWPYGITALVLAVMLLAVWWPRSNSSGGG